MRKKMLMINKRAQSLFSVDKHLKRGSDQVYVFYLSDLRKKDQESLSEPNTPASKGTSSLAQTWQA